MLHCYILILFMIHVCCQEDPYIMLDQPTACTPTKGTICQMVSDSHLGTATINSSQLLYLFLLFHLSTLFAFPKMEQFYESENCEEFKCKPYLELLTNFKLILKPMQVFKLIKFSSSCQIALFYLQFIKSNYCCCHRGDEYQRYRGNKKPQLHNIQMLLRLLCGSHQKVLQ